MPTIQLPNAYDPANPTTTIYNLKTLLEALGTPIYGRAASINLMPNVNSPAGAIWMDYGQKPSGPTTPGTDGVKQVETATLTETVPGTLTAGNATVIVTAAGMLRSPKTFSVALATNDSQNAAATKVRAALTADADIAAFFVVSGATNAIILTAKSKAANDATLNISIADGTCVGLVAAPTSANTTAGVVMGSRGIDLTAVTQGFLNVGQGAGVLPENVWMAGEVAGAMIDVWFMQI